MVRNFLFLLIFFIICGCTTTPKIIPSNTFVKNPVVTGTLINSAAYERGGVLALNFFKPGPEVAANEETDRLSLMLMKGLKETLLLENTRFTIPEDDQRSPDLLLEGYIEDYGRGRRHAHQVLHKNEAYLSVDGDIWLRETGEKIFLFQACAVIDLKNQNPRDVAYQMGIAIAHFIGSRH